MKKRRVGATKKKSDKERSEEEEMRTAKKVSDGLGLRVGGRRRRVQSATVGTIRVKKRSFEKKRKRSRKEETSGSDRRKG